MDILRVGGGGLGLPESPEQTAHFMEPTQKVMTTKRKSGNVLDPQRFGVGALGNNNGVRS